MFIADYSNHRVRKVDAFGVISLVAGNGTAGSAGDGGLATLASLNHPSGIVLDSSGNVVIADSSNNRIRKVEAALGTISTVAGTGSSGYSGDGGLAILAKVSDPTDVFFGSGGNLFIADRSNSRIRKVNSSGTITTVAGNGFGFSGDGGPATSAALGLPQGICIDTTGNLFIADTNNGRVRKVAA